MALFLLALIVVFWLLYVLRSVVLPFVVGLVLAYLLLPPITWAEKRLPRQGRWREAKRISLILLLYIVVLGIIVLIFYGTVTSLVNSFASFSSGLPDFIKESIRRIQDWTLGIRDQVPPQIRDQVDGFIANLLGSVTRALQDALMAGLSYIPSTLGLILGFASLPVFLFFVLKDAEKLKKGFYSSLSPWLAEHTQNIVSIIEGVIGRWVRAQLLLGLAVGILDFTGLTILGISFAPVLAVLGGFMEMVPTLGPWISAFAGVIVTLAIAPDKIIWVVLVYAVVQLLENNLLAPRIQGGFLNVHPAVALFLLVLGAYLAGLWGVILAVPLTATIVQIYKYVRRSAREERVNSSE